MTPGSTVILCVIVFAFFVILIFWMLEGSKPKEKNIKQLEVPAEHIMDLLELANASVPDANGRKDYVAHYKFWARVYAIFPETREGAWRWMQRGTELFVIQTSKKNTKL